MIKLNKVSKRFKTKKVLSSITVTFTDGVIYCIKGRNGSGKTVLLKLLSGLLIPTEGTIECSEDEPRYGIIIETPIFWSDKTGFETLKYLSSFRKIINDDTIEEYLKIVGLFDERDTKVRKYSLGMKQRLAIAQALMENPSIILLDEPTNSLDCDGVEMLKTCILDEKNKGKLVIIATHNYDDISSIIDTTYTMIDGNLV